jgi:hypothetical protein
MLIIFLCYFSLVCYYYLVDEILGYWEFIKLPGIYKKSIKAKCDTGATISALNAEDLEIFKKNKLNFVKFRIFKDSEFVEFKVTEMRQVRSSNGETQIRPVVVIPIQIGKTVFAIDCTLTNRTPMSFPMLLGRTALAGRYLIDSNQSNISRRKKKDE